MSETLPSSDPGAQKRRSTRIAQAVPITVAGVDALGQPFKERTTTVTVNCHGCKYQSKHYVPKNSVVTLEIPRMEPAFPPRAVQGHVVWVQRPRTVRELFQIGLEFETVGNVWGIAFPPEDWFPPEDEKSATESAAPSEELDMDVEVEKTESTSAVGATDVNAPAPSFEIPPSPSPALAMPPAGGSPSANETKIHVMPSPQIPPQEAQAAIAKQMAQIVAEAKESLDKTLRRGALTAINDEMAAVRQQLDSQMHETVDRAIKAAMERISESEVKKLVHQVANKAASIVEEARLASEAQVAQLDSRLRESIKQATSEAAEQAANRATSQMAAAGEEMRKAAEANLHSVEERSRKAAQDAVIQATTITDEARRAAETNLKAAEENIRKTAEDAARAAANRAIQQTVEQDLRHSVEEIMQRIVAEREAKMPSLSVHSSPEAAQAHLEDWKARLAQASEEVHNRTVEQSRAQVEDANVKRREEIEALSSQSSAQIGEKLTAVSQVALANAEQQITERGSTLRKSFDDITIRMEESINAFRARLDEQRAEAERLKALLHEASESALEETRQKFSQIATEQQAENERARNSVHDVSESAVQQTQQRITRVAAEHQDAIGRQMENLIAQRIQSIDPILTSAAQSVMERFSGEIEQKIGSKVDEARRTVTEISGATARAAESRNQLNRQIDDAKAQVAHIQDSIQGRIQQVSDDAVHKALTDLGGAQQEVARLQAELRQHGQLLAEEAVNQREGTLEQIRHASNDSVQSALAKLAEAAQNADKLKESIRGQIESASGQITLIEHAAREKVQRESETAVQKAVADLAFAGQEVVRLQDALRAQKQQAVEVADEAARVAREKIHDVTSAMVQEALSALQNSAAQAAQLRDGIQQQREQTEAHFAELVTQASEQVKASTERETREAIERARQQAANLPSELETACRASIARMEEELDQKSSEMQHSAYEALLKTSEWYQKKAQTNMQATMDRVVEQSSNTITEKAREVSALFASELDHYHVQFLDHGKATIEEAAREAVDRSRSKLTESTEIASATITDRVQHIMRDALTRFQSSSQETAARSLAQIANVHDASLDEFQNKIDDKMTQGVEHAATYLQSQLVPLMESWEDKRQVEEQEWTAQLKQSADESISAYKARLENTTNGWLLASAATLGQNSQAVLDSLSKAAEKQLRDTCSRVLAGMADILRDRLMGISAAVAPEDETPQQ